MKTIQFFFALLTICTGLQAQNVPIKPPKAKKIPKKLTTHGHTRVDNYYWLKERENPKVIDYLKAENKYQEARMAHTKPLQEKLFKEIKARIKQTSKSLPFVRRGYSYYTRYEAGKQYPIYCRKKVAKSSAKSLKSDEEQVLLDANKLAKGQSYYRVGGYRISDNDRFLVYSEDTLGRFKYTIKIKDLKTGKLLQDKILNTTGGITLAADNKTIFYSVKEPVTLRSYRIMQHKIGADTKNDRVVFEEKDPTFSVYVYRTKSRKYIIVGAYSTLTTEERILPANDPDGKLKIIISRKRGHEYSVSHFKNDLYIVTNDQAKNNRLMKAPLNNVSMKTWKEVIPHRKDVLLSYIDIYKDHLVVQERKNGLTQIRIRRWKDNKEHYLPFNEEAYAGSLMGSSDFATTKIRYSYSSLTTPWRAYAYDMNTKNKTLLKQSEVVGGHNPNDYVTKRLYAKARDGVKVPISLVYKKGMKLNGENPLLLYGYGSYGSTIDPFFSSTRLSLLNRGFVYAIAHVRGSKTLGQQWYDDGKMFKKKNTFYDFIDCAKYLIAKKYTKKEKLFAWGGSAGGLLMGAIVNMRPDLFKGVIAGVPFVDVVTTMLDESIPLTTGEFDEWGNPKNKASYDYMLSYSPYDNVEKKNYPNMLVTTGLHDSQVQYWEPAKWVAKLRALKTDNNMLLLKTNMDAGHSGKSGRFESYRNTAYSYAFLLNLCGIKE